MIVVVTIIKPLFQLVPIETVRDTYMILIDTYKFMYSGARHILK